MRLLLSLAVVLAAAFLGGRIAVRLRQPVVMGEIVAGIALGPSVLGLLPGDVMGVLFTDGVRSLLGVLAQLGLVLSLFGIGYRVEVTHLRGAGRLVVSVSLGSVALPFVLGSGLAAALYPWYEQAELRTDGMAAPVLFVGTAMSITAFPVLARILAERGTRDGRTGAVALACAAVQDVLAWGLLAAVLVGASSGAPGSLALMALMTAVFLLVLFGVVRPGLAWLLSPRRSFGGPALTYTTLVVGLLLSAWATSVIGLHAAFGAFLFGVVVPRRTGTRCPEAAERVEQAALLLLPAFFSVTGLSVDLSALGGKGFLMAVAVLGVACAGKFLGARAGARLAGAPGHQGRVLGVLLNARGLTELVLLDIGLSAGVVDHRMFAVMVVMALATTLMTGPLLRRVDRPALPYQPDVVASGTASGKARGT
ncbi:cation:proton antiporter [Streptomyces lavendulae]|uniref:cation:proton antiporter n=1 Tax=Streptomyces lavendulae TaxID=1914 RepID=UPI0025559365|nr:cation:proton antiporter [Streptomyces lavendulae]